MTSTPHDIVLFVSGLLVAGYAVAALYFVRFWRQSRDRLFAWFALAFTLLLVQRAALALAPGLFPSATWYYSVRLLAFALILAAIIDKNRAAAR